MVENMNLKFLNKLRFISFNKEKDSKKNSSYWFLLPYLGLENNILAGYGLINTYLCDDLSQYQYQNCLHLLFKQDSYNKKFNEFIEDLEKHPLYIDTYDTIGDGTLMVVFSLDDILEIVSLFKQGKYSQFPEDFKETYFPKYAVDGKLTHRWKVFQKHEDMKKVIEEKIGQKLPEGAEVWDIPIPDKEVYKCTNHVEKLW
jgi:hypothetical protein